MSGEAKPCQIPIHIPIHYDFASSLCYVTHRVMERIAHRFAMDHPEEDPHPPIVFSWTPLDLAGLLNWRRGGRVPEDRRANVQRVSADLQVPVRVPPLWLDSRPVHATALALEARSDAPAEAAWRERVYSGVFEEGRDCGEPGEAERMAADLQLRLDDGELQAGYDELERRTRAAAQATVTGVPTFMLSHWPMGGIQDDDTMVKLICRFARRARERGSA